MPGKSIIPPFARAERDLVRAAQAGNPQAVSYLLTTYEPVCSLIAWEARRLDCSGRYHDDLRGAANLAILEALPKFDLLRGFKFTTYVGSYVRSAMLKVLYPHKRSASERLRLVSLDAQLASEGDDPRRLQRDVLAQDPRHGVDLDLERVQDADRDAAVRRWVSGLPEGQKGIVVDIFWGDQSHADIARRRGVSRPAVSRAAERAYRRGHRDLARYQSALAA